MAFNGLNAPPPDNHIFLNEGETKVTYKTDTKIPDAGTFIVMKEDHSLGNLVRTELLRDDRVIFAGYRMPHPLENVMHIKIRTRAHTITPSQALTDAVANLTEQFKALEKSFKESVEAAKKRTGDDLVDRM